MNETRAALRSGVPLLAIEAPAGCGKTYEAVSCAIDLAAQLQPHQEVLLLAHTNAAVAEFKRRSRREGARVHATTLDAFALGLVSPYAAALGLPAPVLPGDGAGEVPFHDLAPKALELLTRAPSIGRAVRGHYPVVLLDEHQDARRDQHDLAVELGRGGRVRIFGDPMQAIYDFGDDQLIEWDEVASPDARMALEDPQRWPDVPELGTWLLQAREALKAGEPLPLADAPECVRVIHIAGLEDVPNVSSDRVTPLIIADLGRCLREHETGSTVVLARNNAHVRGLFSAVRGSLVVEEGVDFTAAYEALGAAKNHLGAPAPMATAIVDLLQQTCRGLTAELRRQLDTSLLLDRVERGSRRRIAPLLDALEPIYGAPDMRTWCGAIDRILRQPPDWLKIDLPASLRLLATLRPDQEEAPRAALDAAVQHRHDAANVPLRSASTIHKAKGQEFDHVILAHCSRSPFPDRPDARRLMYVALSRARRSVTILASKDAPSPLLG